MTICLFWFLLFVLLLKSKCAIYTNGHLVDEVWQEDFGYTGRENRVEREWDRRVRSDARRNSVSKFWSRKNGRQVLWAETRGDARAHRTCASSGSSKRDEKYCGAHSVRPQAPPDRSTPLAASLRFNFLYFSDQFCRSTSLNFYFFVQSFQTPWPFQWRKINCCQIKFNSLSSRSFRFAALTFSTTSLQLWLREPSVHFFFFSKQKFRFFVIRTIVKFQLNLIYFC